MPAPLRILVIEDEMIIAMLLEDTLAELGHQVAGVAMRVPQAMELAETVEADLAILDINLDGRKSFPVAQALADRGIKVVFASGYGAAGLEPPFLDAIVIRKPFEPSDIRKALQQAMAPR